MGNKKEKPSKLSKLLSIYKETGQDKPISTQALAEIIGISVSSVEKYLSSEIRYPKKNEHFFVSAGVCSKLQLKICYIEEIESYKGYKIQRLSEYLDDGGDFQKVSESITKMLTHFEVPDCDKDEWGKDEKWERIYRTYPDTLFLLFNYNCVQEIIGYFHFVFVNEDLYGEIIAGENVDKLIDTHDILPMAQNLADTPIEYDIYIVDFFVLRSHESFAANILLFYVIDYLYFLALENIYVKRMVTDITTTKAQTLCSNHGFKSRNKHKTHKIFNKDLKTKEFKTNDPNEEIPSEIYELDFKNKYDPRLFKSHDALNSIYTDYFGSL